MLPALAFFSSHLPSPSSNFHEALPACTPFPSPSWRRISFYDTFETRKHATFTCPRPLWELLLAEFPATLTARRPKGINESAHPDLASNSCRPRLTFLVSYYILTDVKDQHKTPDTKPGRMSSEERREMVLDAAIVEFATYGLYGATTEAIADRVGITQPYIFRLFRNKKELFMAAVDRVYERIIETWESALGEIEEVEEGADAERRMFVMARSFAALMDRREELLLLLQTFAASKDPDVLRMNRARMAQMHGYVTRSTGETGERVQEFFAQGMLLTVAAGLNLPGISGHEHWASEFIGTDKPWSDLYSNPETPP